VRGKIAVLIAIVAASSELPATASAACDAIARDYALTTMRASLSVDRAACDLPGDIAMSITLTRTTLIDQQNASDSFTCLAGSAPCEVSVALDHPPVEFSEYRIAYSWSSTWDTPEGTRVVASAGTLSVSPCITGAATVTC